MSASGSVECPVCGQTFGSGVISEHVNSCLSDQTERNDRPSKKRKSSDWDFLTKPKQASTKNAQSAKITKPTQSRAKSKVGNSWREKEIESHAHQKIDDNDSDVEVIEDGEAKSTNSSSDTSHAETVISSGKQVERNQTENRMGRNLATSNLMPKSNRTVNNVPLAERVRPLNFDNYVGQNQAVGRKSLLQTLLMRGDSIPSMVLWGPPGCGKTTLAKIVAQKCKERGNIKFITMSATSATVNDVKEIAKIAINDLKMLKRKTILFLDEIHRFNKLQQDVLLPFVEDGTITLIGATTENPSFYVNGALLSRCRVIVLEKLQIEDVKAIIRRALSEVGVVLKEDSDVEKSEINEKKVDTGSSPPVLMETAALDVLAGLVDGDARAALNGLQLAVDGSLAGRTEKGCSDIVITIDIVKEALQRSHILYDKTGEEHYNTVSALIKSMRGSDASAALYWMTRMVEGGENPLFIARRLVIFASEDVGLADPLALNQAVATHQACQSIGLPECALNLAQCVVYLARAPKSNEIFQVLQAARNCVRNHEGALPPVPLHLRNAPTKLMKSLGYAKGYKYPPDFSGPVDQDYFPPCLVGTDFFSSQANFG